MREQVLPPEAADVFHVLKEPKPDQGFGDRQSPDGVLVFGCLVRDVDVPNINLGDVADVRDLRGHEFAKTESEVEADDWAPKVVGIAGAGEEGLRVEN